MVVFRVIKKFRQILSRHQKIRIFELILIMILGGFLELGTVSLVWPFVSVAMAPETVMENPIVARICDMIGINSSRGLLIMIACALAALFLTKSIYLLAEYNVQYRFVYSNMLETKKRIFDNFIHRPYEYFLKVNSGEIMRIMSDDITETFSMLSTIMVIFSETVVSVMLITTVFVISPMVTLVMAVLMILLLIIISGFIKPILRKAGIDTQISAADMNKWMLQSIQGIKEIKVMNREDFFGKNYEMSGEKLIYAERRRQILTITPRFLIEAVSMATMFVLLAILLSGGQSLEKLIPIISAVAMAAVRLLPSVNRISSAMAIVSYSEPKLDKLIENLRILSDKDTVSLTMDLRNMETRDYNAIKLSCNDSVMMDHVTYHYPGADMLIFDDACMEIKIGESIGIIGESGAGKTTAVDIILGLLKLEKGRILLDGRDIRENMSSWLENVGYIPQSIFMLDDTIRANVVFGMNDDVIDNDDVWEALREASLFDFVKSLPNGLETEIGERGTRLSGGQKQRIGIARALYRKPKVLIFDEATSALDNATEAVIMESIEALHGKKTLIIIAHRLTTIEMCDHVYKVESGKIIRER